VDDHPDSAQIACMLLAIFGHDCRPALTGAEALDEAERFDPEIVILDLDLPDINGYEVARTLRARLQGRPVHIAALTGWGQRENRVKAFAAGFDQFLVKPVDATKLRQVVADAERAIYLMSNLAS
jgi:CheY-like chemotaxis protein